MYRFRMLPTVALICCVASAGQVAAQDANEIEERIRVLRREADELQAIGRREQAARVRAEIAERMQRLREDRPARPTGESKELHERLNDLLNETADAFVHGRRDQAERLRREIQEVSRRVLDVELEHRIARRRHEIEHQQGQAHEHARDHAAHDHEHADHEHADHEHADHEHADHEHADHEHADHEHAEHEHAAHEHAVIAEREDQAARRDEMAEMRRAMDQLREAVQQMRQEMSELRQRLERQR